MSRPVVVRLFVAANACVALLCFAVALATPRTTDRIQFLCYLLVAVLSSSFKVTLPGIDGTMSVNFLFILLGVLELGFLETLTLGAAAVLVQCYWRSSKRLQPIQVTFNLSQLTVATAAAYLTYQFSLTHFFRSSVPLALIVASIVYFMLNTIAMAVIIALTEGKSMRKTWAECYFWSFPYYLVGAAIAGFVDFMARHIGWQASLLVLPPVYLIYRSYRLYLGKLEDQKRHTEQMSNLHLRTIESLALAIEAKDQTTHDHLQRVRVYAVELAKELGLTHDETEALRAASLLHDIGKLAVPEHIISKPGKLTLEEFEKMKIHPVVGAEILEQVQFPYPVVPIVRSHHEKWDGSGYPDGLKGEQIPVGARILAAVDCLDALASHRQYRRALPLDQAMQKIVAEAGISFDPRVVQVLQRKYVEWEKMATNSDVTAPAKLSTDLKVERGASPDAGFAEGGEAASQQKSPSHDYLSLIAAARQEAQMLFELSHELGHSLSLDDIFSMLSGRLKRLISHDSMAIYLQKNDVMVPAYVNGENAKLFTSLTIPLGQGLSGWVAHNNKPILNGNPSVEPGYLNDPTKYSTLRAALAVPLAGVTAVVGVLALYRASEPFTQDHLRILLAVSSRLGFSIENALKFQIAEDSAATDYLTGLPNARSLFTHLESEIARSKRSGEQLAVLVADLDRFKQINDSFGHVHGNKLLREFAYALKGCCREYDYPARMGGDEFVIVAPGLQHENGMDLAGRIERLANNADQETDNGNILSISVGQAFYPADGSDAEQLLAEADRRMYAIKNAHHAASDRVMATVAGLGVGH